MDEHDGRAVCRIRPVDLFLIDLLFEPGACHWSLLAVPPSRRIDDPATLPQDTILGTRRMWSRIGALGKLAGQIWIYARSKRVTWLEEGRLAACRYPGSDKALHELAERGVTLLINLHERPHSREVLGRHGLTELHLPVRDFTPPTLEQLEHAMAAIEDAIAGGQTVAVHCGGGLGRTGTLLACYLVKRGLGPEEAIARIRTLRPGSVETPQQEQAVKNYAGDLLKTL
jgi:atypical dual specificity phosphatase